MEVFFVFEKPTVEVIKFAENDVITFSCTAVVMGGDCPYDGF